MPDTPVSDELVERVARAMAESVGWPAGMWDEATSKAKESYLHFARAALSASPVQELVEALERADYNLAWIEACSEYEYGHTGPRSDRARASRSEIDAILARYRNQ